MVENLLDYTGIGRERLHLEWLSSAEAQRFTTISTEVIGAVKAKGKLDPESFHMELEAAEMTVNSETVRWLVGKEVSITSEGDVYGRKWDVESYESILDEALEREYHNNLIWLAIKNGSTSARDISKETGLDLLRVSYLLADLERVSRVEFTGMENSKPVFAVI